MSSGFAPRTHRHRHQTTSWPEGRGDCLRHTADLRTVRRRGRTKLQHICAAPCPLGQHTGNLSSQRLVLEKVVRPTCARRGHSTTSESAPGSAAQSTRLWLYVCVLLSACDLRQRGAARSQMQGRTRFAARARFDPKILSNVHLARIESACEAVATGPQVLRPAARSAASSCTLPARALAWARVHNCRADSRPGEAVAVSQPSVFGRCALARLAGKRTQFCLFAQL